MADGLDIRRILVALEPSESGRAALAAAAEMAARLEAELIGVYVEDIDLLNMAALPFGREYSTETTGGRDVDRGAMVRALRGEAGRLRREMEAAARREHVRWSFRVARGRVAAELLTASEDADVMIVGRASHTTPRRVRVGSTTRTVVSRGKHTVIVTQTAGIVARPVLVWFDGSRASVRALVTGARLAAEDHKNIVVLLAAADADEAELLRAPAAALLAELGLDARYAVPATFDVAGVLDLMRRERCRTLVAAAESALLGDEAAVAVLERVDCPVVVVR